MPKPIDDVAAVPVEAQEAESCSCVCRTEETELNQAEAKINLQNTFIEVEIDIGEPGAED